MSGVKQATRDYESFLREHVAVVEPDLALKHELMSKGLFPFMRSTFYRWSTLFRAVCPDLAAAPTLLAVGDLHVENFGTWRDQEGRLIWGVNDVDEAQIMPYAIDLVRVATSAILAAEESHLSLSADDIAAALLGGYNEWLEKGGSPYVLEEEHDWLRQLATGALRNPIAFWGKMQRLNDAEPPAKVTDLLSAQLPKGTAIKRFASRIAGLGSLGRPRFVLLGDFGGALVAREAKAMLPSGWNWSLGERDAPLSCEAILHHAVRVPDPWLSFATGKKQLSGWVIRRLAPHCCRVELTDLPKERDHGRILRAMGRETANIHLGSRDRISAVQDHLRQAKPNWLSSAATKMAEATRQDWQDWRS